MAKTRSPNFPYIPLETALQRARVVWEAEGRHEAAPQTVVGHWNYSAKSSGGRQTIGALRHFGLLEGRGERLRLTELAQAILFSEEGSAQWLRRVQEAALSPTIHKEIWTKYSGDMPSDQNLRYYLVVERGFAETGAAELIREMRATFAFAQMGDYARGEQRADDEAVVDDEATDDADLDEDDASDDSRSRRRAVQLPYSPTDWATLQAAFPLSAYEWDQMLAVLTAMKPALTLSDE